MTDYDFKSLDDKEFEALSADLLGTLEGIRFERFKRGKDRGVDGRYFTANGDEVILQCKHWANTRTSTLISRLHTEELPKVMRLHPKRYMLSVSNSLSRTDKDAITHALHPYIASPRDIFGKEDLNDLLAAHENIERRHYKLWFTSARVLSHILNKPIFDRSAFSLEEIVGRVQRYVVTAHHARALSLLESRHTVIITGEPGAGKTTLAEHLSLHYAANGFQFFKIAENIAECEQVFARDEQQIFYFDDFLGRNYLEALSGHEGDHIAQFIRRVSQDNKKRFILTSRSTILNQGKLLIDNFQHYHLNRNEYELAVTHLTEMDRAKILYSHIWHSGLPEQHVDSFYEKKAYRHIVRHKNFNPRLINFITDRDRVLDKPPADYMSYIFEVLRNPRDVWAHPFEAQLDDFGRALTLLVTLNGRGIAQGELAEAYARYVALPANQGMTGRRDFLSNLRHLTGSFITRKLLYADRAQIDLFNPSIGDYVLRRYASDLPSLVAAAKSLQSESSLETLINLCDNKIVDELTLKEILRTLLKEARNVQYIGFNCRYVARGVSALLRKTEASPDDLELARTCISFVFREATPREFTELARLITIGMHRELISEGEALEFVRSASELGPDAEDLRLLGEIMNNLEEDGAVRREAQSALNHAALDYLRENLEDEMEPSQVFQNVEFGDTDAGEDALKDALKDWLSECGAEWNDKELSSLVNSYDVETRLEKYYIAREDGTNYTGSGFAPSQLDDIDDLFDRA